MKRTNPGKTIALEALIIYEDDDFLIVNKPPHIATLEDRSCDVNMLKMIKNYCHRATVGHRLDKETSGLLVAPKHELAYKYFAGLLEAREVTKIYHALVEGRHHLEEEEIDLPLFTTSNRSRVDHLAGKPSVTLISTLDVFKMHTLLACMPFTGRMHQIRVHLAHRQMSICGDPLYGGHSILLSAFKRKYKPSEGRKESPLMNRLSLHAFAIAFKRMDRTEVRLQAEYPKDFQVTIKQLDKNRH